MLGAAQADALRAEAAGAGGVVRGVGVRPHPQPPGGVGVGEDPVDRTHEIGGVLVGVGQRRLQAVLEVGRHRRGDDGDVAEEHLARRPVDGDHVALVDHDLPVARADPGGARLHVDGDRLGPAHAGAAHPARHHRRVAGLAAAAGQHAARRDHALEVVGVRLATHQHHRLAPRVPLHGGRGVEHRRADRRARGGGQALGQQLLLRRRIELREHQPGQLLAGDALHRLVEGDQVLVDEVSGDPERRRGRPLADAGLQHPQLAALDGELDVAQVAVVGLQAAHHPKQLLRRLRVPLGHVVEGQRVADAGDDVLTLGVGQVVAVAALHAGRRVAGEADTGARVVAEVAEDHRADVHRRAQVVRDPLAAPVEPRPLGVPRVEDGLHGQVELLARVLRERLARLGLHDLLVAVDELVEVVGGELDVVLDAARALQVVHRVGEQRALDAEHRLAEHRDQAAVGVAGEPLVLGDRGQAADRGVVEPDVEDRLHHPGHRELRPRPHRHQQRVLRIAELAPDLVLQRAQRPGHLHPQVGRQGPLGEVVAARVGGHREPGRDGQAEPGHLGEVGALAAEQVLLVLAALGEVVHVLRHRSRLARRRVQGILAVSRAPSTTVHR